MNDLETQRLGCHVRHQGCRGCTTASMHELVRARRASNVRRLAKKGLISGILYWTFRLPSIPRTGPIIGISTNTDRVPGFLRRIHMLCKRPQQRPRSQYCFIFPAVVERFFNTKNIGVDISVICLSIETKNVAGCSGHMFMHLYFKIAFPSSSSTVDVILQSQCIWYLCIIRTEMNGRCNS